MDIPAEKPYALSINMGGDDVSVVAIVFRKNHIQLWQSRTCRTVRVEIIKKYHQAQIYDRAAQLTGKTGDAQIDIPAKKPYALSINLCGDDVSLVAIVYKKN